MDHQMSNRGRGPPSPRDYAQEDTPQQSMVSQMPDDVAIIGMSCQLPSGVNSPTRLWQFCKDKRCAAGPIPKSRFDASHFYHPSPGKQGHFYIDSGSFLEEDIAAFDAPFFNLTEAEATAMDPQHRLMLECAFTAIENAGLNIKDLSGQSDVGVFTSGCKSEAELGACLDPYTASRFAVTGYAPTMFANRISYFFNLRGPSIVTDVACASSLTAIHLAAESIRKGECSCAIVGGGFLQIDPFIIGHMAGIGALGKDGKCYAYDHRAEGYGRGEGVAFIILKSLRAAEMAADSIRAVIRGSGINHCGRSQGITSPSGYAQVELIRRVYREARLSPQDTMVVEGHGTGTAAGDPIEIRSISTAFGGKRTHPLYLGSIKSNFGHLESASGALAVIKCVLMLERGEVLPSANFEKLNPRTGDVEVEIPTSSRTWPVEASRIASINNFGFGGSNAHLVLQEATAKVDSAQGRTGVPGGAKLCILTAKDPTALKIHISRMAEYVQQLQFPNQDEDDSFLERLSYTLCCRRTQMDYQYALTASSRQQLLDKLLHPPTTDPRLRHLNQDAIFCFTGQGSQWAKMGMDLMHMPTFMQAMRRADRFLREDLGAAMSLIEEMSKADSSSMINGAVISQPAVTALQLSLVLLLREYGLKPRAVCGHSSGEIAAAFAAGYVDFNTCMALAYFRGEVSGVDGNIDDEPKGAMMAVGSSMENICQLLEEVTAGSVVVACYNSPSSVTISGDRAGVMQLKERLDHLGIFNRLLKVDRAYHSQHMITPGEQYRKMITPFLEETHDTFPDVLHDSITFFSSVTETTLFKEDVTDPEYWVRNLVSPVRFEGAISHALSRIQPANTGTAIVLVEIGPHSALSGPIREISSAHVKKATKHLSASTKYFLTLLRHEDGTECIMNLVSSLINEGLPLQVSKVAASTMTDPLPPLLTDLPPYPFNKSRRYQHTNRLFQNILHGTSAWNVVLGRKMPFTINDRLECRNVFSLDDIPWLRDHFINDAAVFPMAGYISVAFEALALLRANKQASGSVVSYRLREINIGKAFRLEEGVNHELFTALEPKDAGLRGNIGSAWYTFTISSWTPDAGFTEHCTGFVTAICREDEDIISEVNADKLRSVNKLTNLEQHSLRDISTEAFYRQTAEVGMKYGPSFRLLTSLATGRDRMIGTVRAIDTAKSMPGGFENRLIIHPTLLDACLQIGLFNTAGNDGRLARIKTAVPTFIEDVVVSSDINQDAGEEVKVYCHNLHSDAMSRSSLADMTIFSKDHQHPVIEFQKIKLVNLSEQAEGLTDAEAVNPQKVDWIDHPEFLDSERAVKLITAMGDCKEDQEKLSTLDTVSLQYMKEALRLVEAEPKEPHLSKFRKWMEETISQTAGMDISAVQKKPDISYRDLDWIDAVGQRLPEILKEETHPLTVLRESGLSTIYEESFIFGRSVEIASHLLRIMSLQNLSLRVLEVGAGTGGLTGRILEELDGRFESYLYTDISRAFLEPAKKKFARWSSKMEFAALDLAQDPKTQGVDLGSFDVVIAADVVHATPSITQSLRNIRSMLKPNGTLIMQELSRFAPTYFPFATLPGFWGRPGGPVLSETEWQDELNIAGFAPDPVMSLDWPSGKNMHLLISARCPASRPSADECKEVVVIGSDQEDLSLQCKTPLAITAKGSLEKLGDPSCLINRNVVCVEDMSKPILTETSAEALESLKRLVTNASGVLWVVKSSDMGEMQYPLAHLAIGFARTIRLEYTHLKFVVLHLMDADLSTAGAIASQVYQHAFIDMPGVNETEVEYRWCQGHLQFPRLLLDNKSKEFIDVVANPERTETKPLWRQEPMRATLRQLGMFDSLHFKPLQFGLEDSLDECEVLIEIRATGVNFKDVLICLGRVPWQDIGLECSGIVLALGKRAAQVLQKGDRVALYSRGGLFATHHRCHMDKVVRIPDHLDFSQAASVPIIFSTAYESLINVAHLGHSERVLIHAAAGGVGQAAIKLSQYLGAEIYCTAGTAEKRDLLVKEYGIPHSRIFSSRTPSFAEGIRLATDGQGVDVILNSLAGDLLQASWRCLAPGGRFVEIGKRDALANSALGMAPFDAAVTFAAVDLALMGDRWPKRASRLLQDVMRLFEQKQLCPVTPITTFSVSDLVPALRMLQAGKHIGKVVITNDANANVPVRPLYTTKQDEISPDASYLITGGTGGLGRSLTKWLVDSGARNVILLSRSGRTSNSALDELLKDSEEAGAKILITQCDVAEPEQVMSTLQTIKREGMPGIRGIIHGAMFLKDALFETTSHADWLAIQRPKVKGAINLHQCFDKPGDLDFFICLSSIAGTSGNLGQTSYAASNAFLDGFCRWRGMQSLPASSIVLPRIADAGYVAEAMTKGAVTFSDKVHGASLTESHFFSAMRAAMQRDNFSSHNNGNGVAVGLSGSKAFQEAFRTGGPLMSVLCRSGNSALSETMGSDHTGSQASVKELIAQAPDRESQLTVLLGCVSKRIADMMMISEEELGPHSKITDLGLDSLVAVELRNWMVKEVAAPVPVMDIVACSTVKSLSDMIASRSGLFKHDNA